MTRQADAAETSAADSPLFLCVAVSAGALALLALPSLPATAWLLVPALPALLPWRGRRWYAPLYLGVLLAAWHAQGNLQERWPITRDKQVVEVTGVVADLPQPRGYGRSAAWRFLFEPDAGQDADLPSRIRVAWYRSPVVPHGGECWHLHLKIKAPHGSANPGGFDYERWLFSHNIGATAYVKDATPCGESSGHAWLRLRGQLRTHLDRWLDGVPGHALVDGLVLGDRSRLSNRNWAVFRATGTNHLMAVSGLHLGIMAGAAYFLLRWLWVLWPAAALRFPAQKAALLGSAAVAVAYGALSGFALPSVRAAIMLGVGVVALLAGGKKSLPRGLALAWLMIILFYPLALLSASLWLSFGAVALIAWIMAGRVAEGSVLRALLWLQLALTIGLMPLTVWFFGGVSWVAPVANLFVIPAAALLLPPLMVAVVLAFAFPAIGVPALKMMSFAWWALYQVLAWLAGHAPAAWLSSSAGLLVLLLACVGVLLLLAPRGLPLRPLAVACLLPLVLPRHMALPVGHFRLTVLDVGEGLSAVVQTHGHSLLFDAGPAWPGGLDMGDAVVLPYLHARGIRKLDVMLISHGDMDHRGGAEAVLRGIDVAGQRGVVGGNPCVTGQHWRWDGVDFKVLNPPPGFTGSDNNSGCVLKISAGGYAALLPADIESPAESRLVHDYGEALRAQVLVAPHHGSNTSSSAAFVSAVQPSVVVYPAGWENQYHFPRFAPMARYTAIDAAQFQTGVLGAINVEIGPDGVGPVRAWRRQRRHLWQAELPWDRPD